MRYKKRIIAYLIIVILFVNACTIRSTINPLFHITREKWNAVNDSIESSRPGRENLTAISPESVTHLTEINTTIINHNIPIEDIYEDTQGNISVITSDGILSRYYFPDDIVNAEKLVPSDQLSTFSFGEEGSTIVLTIFNAAQEIIAYKVYDIANENFIWVHLVDDYSENDDELVPNSMKGTFIEGQSIFIECSSLICTSDRIYSNQLAIINATNVSEKFTAMSVFVNFPAVILALENQQIRIIQMDDEFGSPNYIFTLGKSCGDCSEETIALTISDFGKWIGQLTKETVNIWNTERLLNKKEYVLNYPGGLLIKFNNAENIIAVGFEDEISFFNPYSGLKIHSIAVNSPPTAMIFDHNNRLFVWGDKKGCLNVWGIP